MLVVRPKRLKLARPILEPEKTDVVGEEVKPLKVSCGGGEILLIIELVALNNLLPPPSCPALPIPTLTFVEEKPVLVKEPL